MNTTDHSNNDPQTVSFENEMNVLMSSLSTNEDTSSTKDNPLFDYHITLMLSICFGWCGLDRFYLGKIGTGILKLATLGGFGIWTVIDILFLLLNKRTDIHNRLLQANDKKEITILVFLAISGGIWHYFYLGLNRLGFIKIGILALSILLFYINLYQVALLLLFIHVLWAIIDIYLILSGRFTSDCFGVPINNEGQKNQSIALIFSIISGFFGFDRFYMGYRTLGMLKLFTMGGFGLWVVIDFILILLNVLKDSNGNPMIQA